MEKVKQAYADFDKFSAVRSSFSSERSTVSQAEVRRRGFTRYLVFSRLERNIIAELVEAAKRVSEGSHAFLAEGKDHDRHGRGGYGR